MVFGYGERVPLTTVPLARVYTVFSPNGPQVGVRGITSWDWLKLRQSAGFPGLTE
jgi:hypothetical protein